jgi:Zn-dependent peptidase ImmA (M78 family)
MSHPDLPPGERWRQYELHAQGFREFARVGPSAPLNPFHLAKFANLLVLDFDQIRGLSEKTKQHLLETATGEWSGGAVSRALPDGRRIVILNPNHGPMRTHATLMEEIAHVFLGHEPNRLKVVDKDHKGRTISRDYRQADEEAAYATGAAALVPFAALRRLVLDGQTSLQIARHFRVSRELVEYRLKVTRLWKVYRSAQEPTVKTGSRSVSAEPRREE